MLGLYEQHSEDDEEPIFMWWVGQTATLDKDHIVGLIQKSKDPLIFHVGGYSGYSGYEAGNYLLELLQPLSNTEITKEKAIEILLLIPGHTP